MKKSVVIVGLASLLLSCGSPQVKPDPSTPATVANYPTAEFYACGSHWHGLGVCRLDPADNVNNINLRVQGYYTGTIRVYATTVTDQCNYDETVTYNGSGPVDVQIPGKVGVGCTIGIIVSPTYPNQNNSGIEIRSFVGFLRIRGYALTSPWSGGVVRMVQGADAAFSVPTPDAGPVQDLVEGCGLKYMQPVQPAAGRATFGLKSMGFVSTQQDCVIEGALLSPTRVIFTEFVSVYSQQFVPLAIPALSVSNGSIKITADSTVSVISLDSAYIMATSYTAKFDPAVTHTIRLLTVAGRSVVGDYSPKTKKWSWL